MARFPEGSDNGGARPKDTGKSFGTNAAGAEQPPIRKLITQKDLTFDSTPLPSPKGTGADQPPIRRLIVDHDLTFDSDPLPRQRKRPQGTPERQGLTVDYDTPSSANPGDSGLVSGRPVQDVDAATFDRGRNLFDPSRVPPPMDPERQREIRNLLDRHERETMERYRQEAERDKAGKEATNPGGKDSDRGNVTRLDDYRGRNTGSGRDGRETPTPDTSQGDAVVNITNHADGSQTVHTEGGTVTYGDQIVKGVLDDFSDNHTGKGDVVEINGSEVTVNGERVTGDFDNGSTQVTYMGPGQDHGTDRGSSSAGQDRGNDRGGSAAGSGSAESSSGGTESHVDSGSSDSGSGADSSGADAGSGGSDAGGGADAGGDDGPDN